MTLTCTPIAERSAVRLSLPVFMTWVCRGLDSNTEPSTYKADALVHCATTAMDEFKPNDILCILRFIQILTHRKTQLKVDVLSKNVKREIFIRNLFSISTTVFVINTFQRLFTEENTCKETQLSCNLEHAYKLLISGTHVLLYTFFDTFLVIRAINQTKNNHISLYSQKKPVLQFIQTLLLLYLNLLTNNRDDL